MKHQRVRAPLCTCCISFGLFFFCLVCGKSERFTEEERKQTHCGRGITAERRWAVGQYLHKTGRRESSCWQLDVPWWEGRKDEERKRVGGRRGVVGGWEEEEEEEEGGGGSSFSLRRIPRSLQWEQSDRAASLGSSFLIFILFFYGFLLVCVCCERRSDGRAVRSLCSMEAKSLFSLHRALAQPVKMCMFDFPVTILDDLVSTNTSQRPVCVCVCKHVCSFCVSDILYTAEYI